MYAYFLNGKRFLFSSSIFSFFKITSNKFDLSTRKPHCSPLFQTDTKSIRREPSKICAHKILPDSNYEDPRLDRVASTLRRHEASCLFNITITSELRWFRRKYFLSYCILRNLAFKC